MSKFTLIQTDIIRKNMMHNDEMIKTFIAMYLNECTQDFQNLRLAVERGDYAEIKSKAHHIKPTMEYIGASALRQQFQEMETIALQEQPIDLIRQKFDVLKAAFDTVISELNIFYSDLSAGS